MDINFNGIRNFAEENKAIIRRLGQYWGMPDDEVILEMLRLGLRNEVAILDFMEREDE